MGPTSIPVLFFKLQVIPIVFVVTPTASTPPTELVTVYVRVVFSAKAQVEALAGPLIATTGFWTGLKVVASPALAHPALSTAVRVTPKLGHPVGG